ncbi:MAG: polysaccharide deacetylase family protein [Lachnospiraceae bacterium]|nr:polysaccharide deacetylase family protein [Lachnospiraceae bacterium]
MIKIRKDMAAVIVLAVIVAACCLDMMKGDGDSMGTVVCITSVMNEREDMDTRKIAITFDDGPHPYYTEQLLDGLKERGAKASFFVMGKQAEAYPELVLRMHEEGHLVGNHTYSHIQLGKNNREVFKAELVKTNELLSRITGEEPQYVRPPYGSWDKSFETELTMIPVLWTIDPRDWCSTDVRGIVSRVTKKAKENAVILMHDEYESTVTAALEIVDILQKQGYEFVTVDEIFFD